MAQLLLAPRAQAAIDRIRLTVFRWLGLSRILAKGWSLIREGLTPDGPTDFAKYPGYTHRHRAVKFKPTGMVGEAVE